MNRYFIGIKRDGIIICPRMMLDTKNLEEAKLNAEYLMRKHNSSQSIIEDKDLDKITEFKHGKWADESHRLNTSSILALHDIGEQILKTQLEVNPHPPLIDAITINMENGTKINIEISRSVKIWTDQLNQK